MGSWLLNYLKPSEKLNEFCSFMTSFDITCIVKAHHMPIYIPCSCRDTLLLALMYSPSAHWSWEGCTEHCNRTLLFAACLVMFMIDVQRGIMSGVRLRSQNSSSSGSRSRICNSCSALNMQIVDMIIPRCIKVGVRASVEMNGPVPSISHSNDSPSCLVKFSADSKWRDKINSQKRSGIKYSGTPLIHSASQVNVILVFWSTVVVTEFGIILVIPVIWIQ